MSRIITRITVFEDGRISSVTPLPPGEHLVTVDVNAPLEVQEPTEPFDISKLPVFDLGPWPEGVTFSREEIYGDDGR